ncbi:MAG: hypothetical protein J6S71_10155 [Clostridia bacterium]|nr:hypothetical protein [Clostridia bacterium]
MKRNFRRIIALLLAVIFCMSAVISVSADDSIIYDGESHEFIFVHDEVNESGEEIRVMPGDTIKRKLTVKNDAERDVKVNIFVRPLVKAIDSESGSADYLSDVTVTVAKAKENRMAYMFEASADQLDESGEWLMLGTLYSGGMVDLEVTLDFPITLDNEFQGAEFYLEFRVQEFPKEPDDPEPPQTGDVNNVVLFSCVSAVALVLILIPIVSRRRRRDEEEE